MAEKVYLMILDGFGEGKNYPGNAIAAAKMPNLQKLKSEYPHTLLRAAGNDVGLPEGSQGNSEVGHFTMGAGRIVYQALEEVNRSIRDKSFFKKDSLLKAIATVKKNAAAASESKSALHLVGLISDEGVHAHIDHLFALLELAKKENVHPVYIHAITDGRDVPERTAQKYLTMIQDKINELELNRPDPEGAHIATIVGRYYAMDRDHNWDRTEKAYNLYTSGEGIPETDPLQAIRKQYDRNIETDYYIEPVILNKHGLIKDRDAVIFFNYRTDRPRQLTHCFTEEENIGFKPKVKPHPFFVCFGDYSKKADVVFPAPRIANNLGAVLEKNKKTQLRIAETEKYPHVTYFFNSQVEEPFNHETRKLIDSLKVPSYAEKPEMSARGITDVVIKELDKGYDLIVQNFANPDLVGHSGDFDATVKACEVIDECIGEIAEKTLKKGYDLIITSDHGNAEYKIYEDTGDPCPSHSTNPVPFILVSKRFKSATLDTGPGSKNPKGLKDVAPTILAMLGVKQPPEMTGESLLSS